MSDKNSFIKKISSHIGAKLFFLVLIGFLISGSIMMAMYYVSGYYLDEYFMNSDYINNKEIEAADSLQKYVDKNNISTTDTERITEWVKSQKVVYVMIYKNYSLIYDSVYPNETQLEESQETSTLSNWQYYYNVKFLDGDGQVVIYGLFEYQYYTCAFVAEIAISFFIFFFIILIGVKRYIKYILQLENEVQDIEKGKLEKPVTIKGNDELSSLAMSLDRMRISFKEERQNEREIKNSSNDFVTRMAHDLRAPLTTLILYVNILRQKKYKTVEEMEMHLEKINEKSIQLKDMSDSMFEYFLVTGEKKDISCTPIRFDFVFSDIFAEISQLLMGKGFKINMSGELEKITVFLTEDYIKRISDNIISNILKYAKKDSLVDIDVRYEPEYAIISFENDIYQDTADIESTKIGVTNIKIMMARMSGKSSVTKNHHKYCISLYFKRGIK